MPVSILLFNVYQTIGDLGYGIVKKVGPTYLVKLTKKIARLDVPLISWEIKRRVKEYEQEFYETYIRPIEQVKIERIEPKPYRDWWLANKPKRRMKDTAFT